MTYDERACANKECRQIFTPTRRWQIYCTPQCRLAQHIRERPTMTWGHPDFLETLTAQLRKVSVKDPVFVALRKLFYSRVQGKKRKRRK